MKTHHVGLSQEKKKDLSKYDVLVSPPDQPPIQNSGDEQEETHIGNRRFEVDLLLRREEYSEAFHSLDQAWCDEIVEGLFDTVVQHSVPRGRFLRQVRGTFELEELGRDDALQVIYDALAQIIKKFDNDQPQQLEASSERSPTALSLRCSSPTSPTRQTQASSRLKTEGTPTLVSPAQIYGSQSRNKTTSFEGIVTTPRRTNFLPRVVSECVSSTPSSSAAWHLDDPPSTCDDDEISILEQTSFPPPTMFHIEIPPKKKAEEPPVIAISPASMDIVLESTCQGLLADTVHIGNNRFRFFIKLQTKPFHELFQPKKQLTLVEDVYRTVTQHWRGRFQCATTKTGASLIELSPKQAQRAILCMLRHGTTYVPQSMEEPSPPQPATADGPARAGQVCLSHRKSSFGSDTDSRSSVSQQDGCADARRRSVEDLKMRRARMDKVRRFERHRTGIVQATQPPARRIKEHELVPDKCQSSIQTI